MWQKEKLLILSNFFFSHYVFKKASEIVYLRKKVNALQDADDIKRLGSRRHFETDVETDYVAYDD